MSTTKIKSPQAGYTGESTFGDGTTLRFVDGTAEHDGDLPQSIHDYLRGAGFGINSDPADPAETPNPPDPRDVNQQIVGTALRDAAVDPQPEDFLAPINAGKEGEEGNPHGANVVNPEIHASGDQAIVSGPIGRYVEVDNTTTLPDGRTIDGKLGVVETDNELQQQREREYAERALIGDELVTDVIADMGGREVLKGKALDDALRERKLSTSGSADEKRARLDAHQAANADSIDELPGSESTADIAESEGLEGDEEDQANAEARLAGNPPEANQADEDETEKR